MVVNEIEHTTLLTPEFLHAFQNSELAFSTTTSVASIRTKRRTYLCEKNGEFCALDPSTYLQQHVLYHLFAIEVPLILQREYNKI